MSIERQIPGDAARVPNETRNLLRMLVICGCLVVLLATGLLLAIVYRAAEDDARTRVDGSARLLEEHTLRTFRATHSIMDRVIEMARARPLEDLSRDEAAWKELTALARALPEPGTLWVIDTQGVVRLGTVTFPVKGSAAAERSYVSPHLGSKREMVVGPLTQTTLAGKNGFHLSRRIEDAEGNIRGVVVAGFDADAFTDFQQPLPLGNKAIINILDMDGRIILRQPSPSQWVCMSVAGSAEMAAIKQGIPAGTIECNSPLDGVKRMVAWRIIQEFGVAVVAAEAIEDALAPWRKSALFAAGAAALILALLGVLTRFTFASLDREEELVRGLEETVRTRTQEAVARAEEARRANDSKTRFLATASHDLRQPLQAAGMFIEALAARLGESPHAPVVDKLRQSIDATNALLTTLLDVSTLEAGKVEPQISTFPLMPMLANLYDQVEPEATAKNLSLSVVPTGLRITSDSVLLERVLRNLLLNATRYTPQGGVLLGCRRRGDHVAICVVDTGIGIPPDKLDTIFEDFTRLGEKGSGPQRGLGLGLGVVRRTAQLLDHRVEVRSVEGKGSCFAVLVPIAA